MSIPSNPSNLPPINPNPTPTSNVPSKPTTSPSTPTSHNPTFKAPTFKDPTFKAPASPGAPPPSHQVGSSGIVTQSSHLQSPMATGPWAAMFPSGATPQQLTQFINSFLKSMISEMKRSDQQWKASQDEMKKVANGDDPDE
ncbi:MAG: hypothetical protein NTX49_06065 [Chlamydiae bacterium]|nr:hypothetical protein [Chlamydiota bacterium]